MLVFVLPLTNMHAFLRRPVHNNKLLTFSDDEFDGISRRCDNVKANFWHVLNGEGERHATVMLRRKHDVKDAGIYTYTACGYPQYIIKDIYVFI